MHGIFHSALLGHNIFPHTCSSGPFIS